MCILGVVESADCTIANKRCTALTQLSHLCLLSSLAYGCLHTVVGLTAAHCSVALRGVRPVKTSAADAATAAASRSSVSSIRQNVAAADLRRQVALCVRARQDTCTTGQDSVCEC